MLAYMKKVKTNGIFLVENRISLHISCGKSSNNRGRRREAEVREGPSIPLEVNLTVEHLLEGTDEGRHDFEMADRATAFHSQ